MQSFKKKRQAGVALMMVLVLMAVLMLAIAEFTSSASVQVVMSDNLAYRQASFYAEQAVMIQVEEFLYQDITPPPTRTDRELTAEQQLAEERQKGSDSYHDFWAKGSHQEKTGPLTAVYRVYDEDRKFNINSLVHPQTGEKLEQQAKFFGKLLNKIGVREGDEREIVDAFVDYIDKDNKGQYEKDVKNGPLSTLRECLKISKVSPALYYGYKFPKGELPVEDDAFGSTSDSFSFLGTEPQEEGGASSEKIPPLDEWEDLGIRAGLKDVLTVYGKGSINLNTAPLPILEALFNDHEAALDVIRERKKLAFTDLAQLNTVPEALAGANEHRTLLDFHSEYFRVEIDLESENMKKRTFAILRRWEGKAMLLFRGPYLQ